MTKLAGYKLIAKQGLPSGQEFKFTGEEIFIGRGDAATIQIDSQVVARLHVRIMWKDKKVFIEDLKSSNGTYVNGRQITKETILSHGDQISLGQEIFLEFLTPSPKHAPTRISEPNIPPPSLTIFSIFSSSSSSSSLGLKVIGATHLFRTKGVHRISTGQQSTVNFLSFTKESHLTPITLLAQT